MLDNARVHLMCELALYEKHHERDVFEVNKYFKYDFIIWHILLASLRYTVCAAILAVIVVFFRSDVLFYNINISGLQATFRTAAWYYCIGLAVYLCIAGAVSVVRYQKARSGMAVYASMLRRLLKTGGTEKNIREEGAAESGIRKESIAEINIREDSLAAVNIRNEGSVKQNVRAEGDTDAGREKRHASRHVSARSAGARADEAGRQGINQTDKTSGADTAGLKPVDDFLLDAVDLNAGASILDEPFIDISIVNEIRRETHRDGEGET